MVVRSIWSGLYSEKGEKGETGEKCSLASFYGLYQVPDHPADLLNPLIKFKKFGFTQIPNFLCNVKLSPQFTRRDPFGLSGL